MALGGIRSRLSERTMPIPRKNVRPMRENDDMSPSNALLIPRKRQLFDWDHINLGANVDLTSSESDLSSSSLDQERGDLELDTTPKKDPAVDQTTFEWVRNLVALRRNKLQSSLEDHSYRTTGKGWLHDQHKALENGSIPVTFKCILAASGVSRLYNKCRDDFRKPEYRSRYWNWSINFILLIDFFIDNGNVDVTVKSPKKYHDLIPFLHNCNTQKSQGNLSAQRDQLLTAIGVKWDLPTPESEDDDGESSESSFSDSVADETWELPTKSKTETRPRRKVQTRKAQKRTRGTVERDLYISKRKMRTPSPPSQNQRPAPTRQALITWAAQMFELRRHYNKAKGNEELYDIPHNQLQLKIWMNTEAARCTMGLLSETCCGILLAAEILDSSEDIIIGEDSKNWGEGFVLYLDYMLHKGDIPYKLANFMYGCRRTAIKRSLASERDALLCGVDGGWLESSEMQLFVFSKEKRRSERVTSAKHKRARAEDVETYDNGHVVEVLIDSGTVRDQRIARKKRKQATLKVTQMLSSMIGGEVAVTVEGRNPTRAERDAREWVLRAGAKDFDLYARNWFRAAVTHE